MPQIKTDDKTGKKHHPDVLKKINNVHKAMGLDTLKADPGVVDTSYNFGGTMPRPATIALLTDTVDNSALLQKIDFKKVDVKVGDVRIMTLDSPVSRKVSENTGQPDPRKPSSMVVNYVCKKMRADIYFTTDELEAAAEDNFNDFENKVMGMFALALGNDLSDLAINGDSSLSPTSPDPWDQLRCTCDGLLKRLDTGGNIYDRAGEGIGIGMFHVLKRRMPPRYMRNISSFNWFCNSSVMDIYSMAFADQRMTSEGDRRLNNITVETPAGITPFITNVIPDTMGASGTPDAVVDATGALTITVDSILVGTTDYSGRMVEVTYIPTGQSEICEVTGDGTNNKITTSSYLGADAADTTASNYVVKRADETAITLGNPKTYAMVSTQQDWRIHYEFNKDFDRHEYTMYFFVDTLLPLPQAWVKMKNLKIQNITNFDEWTGWAAA